jgi:hypothetical protein
MGTANRFFEPEGGLCGIAVSKFLSSEIFFGLFFGHFPELVISGVILRIVLGALFGGILMAKGSQVGGLGSGRLDLSRWNALDRFVRCLRSGARFGRRGSHLRWI